MRSSLSNFIRTIRQKASLVVGVTLLPPGKRPLENLANKVDSKSQRRMKTDP